MAYLSLYRKWRPLNFSDVVGQVPVVRTLENSLNNGRIAHAYLFTGPRGTGKTTLARIMAKGLNCEQGPTSTPCGECGQCISITQGQSLGVIEVDGASNRGIEEIRELRERVKYAPTDGRYKVYIIDEVHMLTTEAFNALLKTLEEPPNHVVFMFATTDPHKIPATILSRCQRYDLKRFSISQIHNRLRQVLQGEGKDAESQALDLIATHAEGIMRDALGILDQCLAYAEFVTVDVVTEILGVVRAETIEAFTEFLLAGKSKDCLKVIDELYENGKDLAQFNQDLLQYLRTRLLQNSADSIPRLLEIVEAFSQSERELRYAVDVKIPLELTVLRLTDIKTEWEKLEAKVLSLENKLRKLEEQGVPLKADGESKSDQQQEAIQTFAPRLSGNGDDRDKLRQIQTGWDDFLKALRQERLVQQEAFLREGSPVTLEDQRLVLAFPKERGFHKASIEQDRHREPAERTLSKFFGTNLTIHCITASPDEFQPEEPQLTKRVPETHSKVGKDTPNKPSEELLKAETESASSFGSREISSETEDLDESVAVALKLFGGKVVKIKDS